MKLFEQASTITVSTGGAYDIGSVSDGMPSAFHAPFYMMTGSPTLSTNFTITHSTITENDKNTVAIFYKTATITLNLSHVFILGQMIPDHLSDKEYLAIAVWNGLAWDVSIHPNFSIAAVIGEGDIGGGAVITDSIGTGAVTEPKIGAAAVTAAKIGTGAVTEDKIGAAAVTSTKIATGAVTAEKLAAASVTADKIAPGAVVADKIGAGAVTAEKIGAGAITGSKIAAGTITTDKLSAGTFGTASIAAESVTAEKILAASVTEAKLASDAVTNAKIGAAAVTVNKVSTDLRKSVITHTVAVITYAGVVNKIRVPFKASLTNIYTSCIATMDNTATNYERLLLQDHAGNNMIGSALTTGRLTFPDSFTAGQTLESTVTGNNAFTAGQILQITPEKSVATTGVVIVNLEFTLSE